MLDQTEKSILADAFFISLCFLLNVLQNLQFQYTLWIFCFV